MIPNETLRDYVQGTAFNLQLGRTHIAAMVWLDVRVTQRLDANTPRVSGPSVWGCYISGVQGCERRGLVIHHYTKDPKTGLSKKGLWHHYTITKAGKLVIALLKEAGIYEEYASQLVVVEKAA